MTEIYRSFKIEIENGKTTIWNRFGAHICTYAGSKVEFAKAMIDNWQDNMGKTRKRRGR